VRLNRRTGRWEAQGFHHRYLGHDMPDRRVGPILVEGYDGIYAARVSMKGPHGWVQKRTPSTFFPDHWAPKKVKAAIDEAFANRVSSPDPHRWRGMAHGLVIDGSYHRNGHWNSAWPVLEDDW